MSDEETVQFTLRLPRRLHAALKDKAARDFRSLHAEIMYLLQQAAEEAPEGQESKRAA
jgi:hypothetical protein